MITIAEVKTKSPFGYESPQVFEELFEIAQTKGDWIAVHTDERWGGSFDKLKWAVEHTDKPILAKGLHQQMWKRDACFEIGAEYVLVVGVNFPARFRMGKILWEPESFKQFYENRYRDGLEIIVWNNRNLNQPYVPNQPEPHKSESIELIHSLMPTWIDAEGEEQPVKLFQASFIKSMEDVSPLVDGFIVGEGLVDFA